MKFFYLDFIYEQAQKMASRNQRLDNAWPIKVDGDEFNKLGVRVYFCLLPGNLSAS